MTKKDYIAIAAVLNANLANDALVADMADMLEEDNPRFDRERFMRASTDALLERTRHNERMILRGRGEL